jgi:two-component system nitrogen regulation sensor histidine kinase GlnL
MARPGDAHSGTARLSLHQVDYFRLFSTAAMRAAHGSNLAVGPDMQTADMNGRDPYRRILDNINTAVLMFDRGLRIRYVNPAGEVLFEVSARHVTGQPFSDLLGQESEVIQSLTHALETGHPYTEREVRLCLANGREVTVDLTVTLLYESSEVLLELLPVDRHLRIAREESLIAQHNNTRLLMRGMAHEINNPLGGIRGAAQLLDGELPDEALREYTRVIIGEADRLQSLLARMLGPTAPPARRALNIHEVVERVRTLIQAEAPRTVTIVRDYDPSIPPIHGDSDQLIQALLNITRNALQAIDGSGTITLRTRIQRRFTIGTRLHRLVVTLYVIDDGPGVPPDMRENIFYPMITSRAEGTGLGLPIAQSIVNQHGGLIECSSRPGETIFSITLPLEDDNDRS